MRFFSTLVASIIGSLIALAIIGVFLILFLVGLAASSGDQAPRIAHGSILVYHLAGTVPENVSGDPLLQAFADEAPYDLRDLVGAIEAAGSDDRIEGLWIKVADASIPWATAQDVRTALLTFKESGKPVVASSSNFTMAENEYFLASAADQIYASPEALFEFNGFYVAAEFYKRLLDKLDVEPQIVKAGRYKGAVEPYDREDLSRQNREQLNALLHAFEDRFNSAVAESRSLTAPEVSDMAQSAAIMTARDASDAGLIDGLLFHDQVEDEWRSLLEIEDEDELELVDVEDYVRAHPNRNVRADDEIAIVYADGVIVAGSSDPLGNPFATSSAIGTETFRRAIQTAVEDDDVKGIVVRINSPGGFAPAADEMRYEIERAGAVKPVIVSMGGVAASGGYWMATAADQIVADQLTITGSIGVYSVFFDVGDLFESKLGITHDIVATNPHADMYSGLRSFSAEERRVAQESVDETYRAFLRKVADGRNMSVDEVDEIAQGRVWIGKDALDVGLVDTLGSLNDALRMAAERASVDEFKVVEFPRPKTFFEQFESALGAKANAIFYRNAGKLEAKTLERIRFFDDLLSDYGTVQARLPFNLTVE